MPFPPAASPPPATGGGAVPPPAPPLPGLTPSGGGRRRRLVVPAVTVIVSLLAGFGGGLLARDEQAEPEETTVSADPVSTSSRLDGDSLDVAAVLDHLAASVVSIETTVQARQGPFLTEGEGAGTGIVIDDEGTILTNAHVVEGATEITVALDGDDEPRSATLIASDASADIAVLQVDDASGLVAAELADGTSTQVGDEVVAIGNALALEGSMTVTQGIVSALDRSIETNNGTLTHLIQTDAAISSGNSGGALVNAAGEVIGINTAVASSGGSVQASNIGFAISIDKATAIADELLDRTT